MRTSRRSSVLLVLFALVPSAFAQQTAKGKAAETATTSLLRMNAAYLQTPAAQKTAALTQLRTMAAQRQQLLSALIQTNPADVLRIAIPNNIRGTMPAAVQGYLEQTVQAQGVLEVLIEDSTTGSKMHYGLTTATGKLSLHFADKAPTNLLTGSIVQAQGVQVGGDLALACCNSTSTTTSNLTSVSSVLPNTLGAQNTLVILVDFLDNSTQTQTPAAVQNAVFNQTSNWDLENSFQQTSLTGAVAGWFTIPVSESTSSCDTTFVTAVKSNAKSAAQNAGFNLSSYTHFIYVMPASPCTWWGFASIGGGDVWINGKYGVTTKVVSHEMGHNFGLYHSHTVDCGTAVACSGGTLSEYGDWIDTMGASQAGHFNAFQKERLGWLNYSAQPPITAVSSSGAYQISPYEVQDGNPKALKILQSATSNSYYYVEFRQAQGFDAFLSNYTDVVGGLLLHLANPSTANSSDLLDLTPTSPASFAHPALVAGQSYTDSSAGLTITPTSVSSTGATVQVTFGGATCTNATPSVSVSPSQSAYVLSGTAVNFTVTVSDNDSTACAPATFNLTDSIPSGWTGVWSTSALSLSPGGSASATLTVTSPAGTPDGFYNIGVSAANSGASSFAASATGTYVISTPAPLSISVSTNQASYSPGQTVFVTVTLTSGSSPDMGANVSATITPPNGKNTAQSGTTGSVGTFSFSYKLSKRAAVGTYGVQASTATTGAAASMGTSTTFTVQ
jgi:hypothetical protein